MFTVWYYLDYLLSKNEHELILALCLKIMIVAEAYSVLGIVPRGFFVFITSLTQLHIGDGRHYFPWFPWPLDYFCFM